MLLFSSSADINNTWTLKIANNTQTWALHYYGKSLFLNNIQLANSFRQIISIRLALAVLLAPVGHLLVKFLCFKIDIFCLCLLFPEAAQEVEFAYLLVF